MFSVAVSQGEFLFGDDAFGMAFLLWERKGEEGDGESCAPDGKGCGDAFEPEGPFPEEDGEDEPEDGEWDGEHPESREKGEVVVPEEEGIHGTFFLHFLKLILPLCACELEVVSDVGILRGESHGLSVMYDGLWEIAQARFDVCEIVEDGGIFQTMFLPCLLQSDTGAFQLFAGSRVQNIADLAGLPEGFVCFPAQLLGVQRSCLEG